MFSFVFLVASFISFLHHVRGEECLFEETSLIQTQLQTQGSEGLLSHTASTKHGNAFDLQAGGKYTQASLLQNSTGGTKYHLLKNPIVYFTKYNFSQINWKDVAEEYKYDVTRLMYAWLSSMVLVILIVLCCFNARPDRLPFTEDPVETMSRHHFGCFKTPMICCCSFFCPIVQWAETMHWAHLLPMLAGVAIYAIAAALNSLTLTGHIQVGMFTSALIIFYRQKLRKRFGMKAWTCENCLIDFLYVCCCPCCAISQEAQAVRYSMYDSEPRPAYSSQLPPRSGNYVSTAYTSTVPTSGSTIITSPSVYSQYPSQAYGSGPRVISTTTPSTSLPVRSLPSSGDRVIPPPSGYGSGRYLR